MTKGFGFDYDGTIVNIEPQKAKVFGNLVGSAWGADEQEASKYWLETGGASRRSKFDYFYTHRFGKDLSEEEYREIEEKFSLILKKDYYPNLKLLPGALEVLKFVRSHFDFVFVSSGVPTKEIRYLVRLNGVGTYFDLILGTDEKYPSKREHFRKIIEGKTPDLLIYMADGLEDMRVGKEFGAYTIGIPTNHPRLYLRKAGADYICNLNESIEVIKLILIGVESSN